MLEKTKYNKQKTLPEIFEKVGALESFEEKVHALQLYHTPGLEWFVDALYNRDWSDLDIPDFEISNKPVGLNHSSIGKAIKRIERAYELRISNPKTTEKHLILVLSEMSVAEAQLLVDMFNWQKEIPGISKEVWKGVYPHLFPEFGA